jgi:uncharacterized protein (DUF58 family)
LGTRLFGTGLLLGTLAAQIRSVALLTGAVFAAVLPWACLVLLPTPRLHLEVETPRRLRVGAPTTVRIRVRNTGRRRSPALFLRNGFPLLPLPDAAVEPLAPGGEAVCELVVTPPTRCLIGQLPVAVVVRDAFGLVARRHLHVLPTTIAIAPRVVAAPPLPAASSLADGDSSGTAGIPAGLRPWRQGDGLHRIAWRATARRSTPARLAPVVREQTGGQPDALVLGAVGGTPDALEGVLEVVAALAIAALAAGRTVRLVLGSRTITAQRPEPVLDALAAVAMLPDETPAGCTVVVGPASGSRRDPHSSYLPVQPARVA